MCSVDYAETHAASIIHDGDWFGIRFERDTGVEGGSKGSVIIEQKHSNTPEIDAPMMSEEQWYAIREIVDNMFNAHRYAIVRDPT